MQNERRKLAGDLIHVRDHEKKALRRSERGAQSPSLKCSVDRPCCTPFALHLDYRGHCIPEIFQPSRSPRIGAFSHRRGRRDGVTILCSAERSVPGVPKGGRYRQSASVVAWAGTAERIPWHDPVRPSGISLLYGFD
jgi:hypothetical protein